MIETKLNADGTISLTIGNETIYLNANELDRQIASLARMRAQMKEAIPEEPTPIETVIVNPSYMVRTDNVTKASLLRIRHGGFGWLNFELPSTEAVNMKQMWKAIVEKLDIDPVNDLYGVPERNLPKLH